MVFITQVLLKNLLDPIHHDFSLAAITAFLLCLFFRIRIIFYLCVAASLRRQNSFVAFKAERRFELSLKRFRATFLTFYFYHFLTARVVECILLFHLFFIISKAW